MSETTIDPTLFDTMANEIARHLSIERASISPESNLNDIGLDSLGLIDFMFEVEEKFNLNISPNTSEKLSTVDDLARFISLQIHQANGDTSVPA